MFDMKEMRADLKTWCDEQTRMPLYRIVDINTYEVYDYQDGKLIPYGHKCYELWNHGEPCINCVSRRAVISEKKVTKLEYLQDEVFLIHALCMGDGEKRYAIELADNVSDSFLVKLPMCDANNDLGSLVLSFNDMAVKDSFTGLYNKNYIADALLTAIKASKQQSKELCAALLDIDSFKQVNDTYGHVFGDEVLLYIAERIKELMKDDRVCGARFGGDEFFLIVQNMEEAAAERLCAELAKEIATHDFTAEGETVHIQISYGVGEYEELEKIAGFIARLDKKMYEMKRRYRESGK